MEFEDLLKEIGGFGRYQLFLIGCFQIPLTLFVAFLLFGIFFMLSIPSHQCLNPALKNLTKQQRDQLPRPTAVIFGAEQPSQCSSYMFNYTEALLLLDSSKNGTEYLEVINREWIEQPCIHGWEYDTTWYDETAVTRWNLVCNDDYLPSLVITLFVGSGALGTVVFGNLADRIGRKHSCFVGVAILLVSGVLTLAVPSFIAFIIFRITTGIVGLPIYQASFILGLELVLPEKRTAIATVPNIFWVIGSCLLSVIAYVSRSWITLSAITLALGLPFVAFWWIIVESPRWYISQKKYEEAERAVRVIVKWNRIAVPADLMKKLKIIGETEENRAAKVASSLDLIRVPRIRKHLFFLNGSWGACGIAYYGLQLNTLNLYGNEFLNFFILCLAELPSYLTGWYFMEKIGRRWSNVGFTLLTAISCCIAACVPVTLPGFDLAMSLIGKFGISAAFLIVYQQGSEIFPTPLRNAAIGISSGFSSAVQLVVPYAIYFGLYNRVIPFIIIGIFSFLGSFSASFLPETLNANLPQTVEDGATFGAEQKYFSWKPKRHVEKRSPENGILLIETKKEETAPAESC